MIIMKNGAQKKANIRLAALKSLCDAELQTRDPLIVFALTQCLGQ